MTDPRTNWPSRAAEIRSRLPQLLWGGDTPPRPPARCRVLMQGEAAVQKMRAERFDEYARQFEVGELNASAGCDVRQSSSHSVSWKTKYIEYEGWPESPPVRAILRVPDGCDAERTAPALLCLHSHVRGLLLGCAEVDYFAIPLTATGFVTLCPDALPFADRRLHVWDEMERQYPDLCWDERFLATEANLRGQTLLGRQLWELMRAVDLLSEMPMVDARRIGATGHSQGGLHAWWLAALDERIAAVAANAAVSTYRSWIKARIVNALVCYVPSILSLADQEELVALIAPRPLMLNNYESDEYFPREGSVAVERCVREVYASLGAASRFAHEWVAGGHAFPVAQQQLALAWLRRWLLNEDGG